MGASSTLINWREMIRWAAMEPEREVCGIVVLGVAHLFPNMHKDPARHFTISPEDLRAFFKDHDIADWSGVWHSHPQGQRRPSDNDRAWHPQHLTMWIVAGTNVIGYMPDGSEVEYGA